MKYDAVFTINCDDKPTMITRGGSDGVNSYLEFELAPKNQTIKIEWADSEILKFEERGSQGGIPMKVTIDKNQGYNVVYRGGVLCEPGQDKAWHTPRELGELRDFFSAPENIQPLGGARDVNDFHNWLNCMGGFAAGGGAMGGAVGALGGAATAASGAALGAAFGGAYGAGFCTANALYNPSTVSTIHVAPQQPPQAVYIPPFHRDMETTDPFMPRSLPGTHPKPRKVG